MRHRREVSRAARESAGASKVTPAGLELPRLFALMPNANRELRRKLFWMIVIALVLRVAVMLYVYPMQLDPARDHWAFGFETGRIARAIATGRGFSDPLFAPTGPTAWMTPVYPYIVAGVFKVFGVFSKTSALVILCFNALTSALTCLPIFFFARRTFNERTGLWAGWFWTFFPYAIYWPVQRIWDTWLVTLLLAILFCMALRMAESMRVRDWVAFGLLSGVAALTDPVVLSVLPILALWALWRLHRECKRWLLPAIGCLLATILVISPWFIRNERVFHEFIPFRDNFNLALRVGNIGDTRHMLTLQAGPWLNDAEWNEFQKYGEIAYMEEKGSAAADYISVHRREYVGNCVRRAIFVWTRFWYLDARDLLGFPPEPAEIFLYTGMTILALLGLRDAFRRTPYGAAYVIVMIFFPVTYYVTSLEPWYRYPMDPMVLALAAYAITMRLAPARESHEPASISGRVSDAPAMQRRTTLEAERIGRA